MRLQHSHALCSPPPQGNKPTKRAQFQHCLVTPSLHFLLRTFLWTTTWKASLVTVRRGDNNSQIVSGEVIVWMRRLVRSHPCASAIPRFSTLISHSFTIELRITCGGHNRDDCSFYKRCFTLKTRPSTQQHLFSNYWSCTYQAVSEVCHDNIYLCVFLYYSWKMNLNPCFRVWYVDVTDREEKSQLTVSHLG